MKPKEACPRCGASDLIPSAAVFDKGEGSDGVLKAGFDKKPNALFFRGRVAQALKASICGKCGHAELYVENPQSLYQDYLAVIAEPASVAAKQQELRSRAANLDACLACGTHIPDDQTKCPSCGWTYKSEAPA
jgi:RNA polymerase subunit RPABC4/transcription elongation factor Spt4